MFHEGHHYCFTKIHLEIVDSIASSITEQRLRTIFQTLLNTDVDYIICIVMFILLIIIDEHDY